ncbi:alpha-N-acetylneuraminide alpha-2,8-sialyltransferase-like isoform X2 [Antedon mediterranea]|uniref:alpha-N-acetylneuraminide alpha-2,8-sialyltransferase-like isoform X2 n=1 Tax=Antedon mediterranea TaxID=105859 RepID=UPI003AF8E761
MKLIRYQHSLRLVPYAKMRRCRRTKCMSAIILVIFIVAIYKGNHRLIRRKSSITHTPQSGRFADFNSLPKTEQIADIRNLQQEKIVAEHKILQNNYEKENIEIVAAESKILQNNSDKESIKKVAAESKILQNNSDNKSIKKVAAESKILQKSSETELKKVAEEQPKKIVKASHVLVRRVKVFKRRRFVNVVVVSKNKNGNETASKPEYSKRGFIMSRKEEKSFQIHNIAEYLLKPWQRNDTNIQEMRSNMNEYVDFSLAVATKENMEIGQRVKMYFESKDISIDIDEETYNTFPKQWPRDSNHPQYRTCSLVGSSGILSDSQCGKQIDSADYVIRMNVPPIQNYTSDAGFKSNMTTMNPSVVSKRYNNLTLEADIVTFLRDMRQYNQDLLVPALSMKVGYDLTMNVVKAFKREPNHPLHLLLMHPKHFLAMSHFWKDKFDIDAKRISSGLYMTSFALSICDEVTAYGFWPFHTDHRNRTLEYHYYEKSDSVPLPKVHHFAQEYRILLGLHETGVLRLHPNTCS